MRSYENIKIPTALSLPEPLQIGSTIEVRGHLLQGQNKDFAIELLSGQFIVLHLNFRLFHEQNVVLNSALKRGWGTEIYRKNPLKDTDKFHIKIKIYPKYYHVTCNNTHIAFFPHRCPFQSVQAVGLKLNIHVDEVIFDGFPFETDWDGEHDFEHKGYDKYGTETYAPPYYEGQAKTFD